MPSTADPIYISESTIEFLSAASEELQRIYQDAGLLYSKTELQQVLVEWLEASIEQLAEDALFHTLQGHSEFAIGRRLFQRRLAQLQPLSAAVAA